MEKDEKVFKLIGLVIGVISIVLCFVWFDWKLFTVLFLFLYSNNIGQSFNYIRK